MPARQHVEHDITGGQRDTKLLLDLEGLIRRHIQKLAEQQEVAFIRQVDVECLQRISQMTVEVVEDLARSAPHVATGCLGIDRNDSRSCLTDSVDHAFVRQGRLMSVDIDVPTPGLQQIIELDVWRHSSQEWHFGQKPEAAISRQPHLIRECNPLQRVKKRNPKRDIRDVDLEGL